MTNKQKFYKLLFTSGILIFLPIRIIEFENIISDSILMGFFILFFLLTSTLWIIKIWEG